MNLEAAPTFRPSGDPKLDDLRARLSAELGAVEGAADIRQRATELLAEYMAQGRAALAEHVRAHPLDTRFLLDGQTALTDRVVIAAVDVAISWLTPNPNPTKSERITVLAVGGYGRAEMAPFSDVDLLFLTPYKQTPWGERVIEAVMYILWDLKLKVGQAVRTVDECLRLGQTDITIRTALLEHRFLVGERDAAEDLQARLWSDLFAKTGPQFIEAKLEERAQRHKRQGGSRYLLEPNVKEGKGGLRDLQTLYWIAKYLHNVSQPADLVAKGVFTQEEFEIFERAEGFLWTVRTHLHLTAGRALEQLTFDMQVEVARVLGYEDRDGRLAVELFMQDYFSHAREVGELTRVFLTGLEAQHVKAKPSLRARLFSALSFSEPEVGEGFVVRNGRLDYESADCIKEDPIWIFRLFKTGLETGYLIHPDAMRLLRANLDLVEGPLRNDPRAAEAFLSLMLEYHDPERALRRMNELGVLGAYIPEFGRIVAMMQFNMYHHYTVDEHTIRCIAELAYIEASQLESELPLVSEVLRKGVNRRVLYVALLLHDIGKGLPEDHSDVGARLAQDIAPRLGLSEDEVETVVWLVQNHLVMSDVAQKRDISDVRTVSEFAKIVESPSRLKLLTVLTVCDIRGVGPNVWNNWKAMLLRGLYRQTIAHLTGQVHGSRPERVETAKEALVDALEGWPPPLIEAELERHYDAFWLGLDTDTHAMFARMMTQIKPDEPVSAIDHDPSRDATRALFVMPDHPGIFSRMSGALALVGANVVEARIYTSSDGIATAAFWIQDREGVSYEKARLTRLRSTIKKTLRGEVLAREALKDKDREKKRERDFVVPTEITFDNDGSDIYTIIEVDTRDRPGLLFDLTRTLTANNISIASAIIATYGKQAVDSFYVKDLFGLKIHAPQKQAHLADRLRAAIQEGFERAGG